MDRIYDGGFLWFWSSQPDPQLVNQLINILGSTRLNSSRDSWSCELYSNVQFSIAAYRRSLINSDSGSEEDNSFQWLKEVRIKVSCFAWRAAQIHIHFFVALKNLGINIASSKCGECNLEEETSDHLLCVSFAKYTWEWIFRWCGIPMLLFDKITKY